MEKIFGDCVSLGGYRYAILLVDLATRYCWLCGMSSLSITSIISTLENSNQREDAYPTVTLKFRQEINKWKWPTVDPLKRFKHHHRSRRTPIFEWISRAHMAYSYQNDNSIHHREASRKRILVLSGLPCRNDAQPSSWPLRPETHHVIWTRPQFQTQLQDMVWIVLYKIFQPWHRQQSYSVQIASPYPGWNRSQ